MRIVSTNPEVAVSKSWLDEIYWSTQFRKKKSPDVSRNEFLRTIPFFERMTDKQLKTMAKHLHERRYEENEYLFEANHPGAALFILLRGEVAVEMTDEDEVKTQLALIKSGEFLGDLALLDQCPRSASARATKPTAAYALFRGDLNMLQKTEPEIACEIYKTLASIVGERLKATNRHVGKALKKVA
jgi:CRP/FNR family cyclic AMP-dependent transcriptional regulator